MASSHDSTAYWAFISEYNAIRNGTRMLLHSTMLEHNSAPWEQMQIPYLHRGAAVWINKTASVGVLPSP